MNQLPTILPAGETEAGSAEVQPARDNPPRATNGRRDGRQNPAIPFYQIPKTIQSFALPKKTSMCLRLGILLTVTGKCPIHVEPVHHLPRKHIMKSQAQRKNICSFI